MALNDWEFSREFEVDAKVLAHKRVVLQCSSIDTIGMERREGDGRKRGGKGEGRRWRWRLIYLRNNNNKWT